ncbi:tetratricopeptide repeat protein [Gallaecimonas mangrovi]|uniref:tetratricopeptide repeat protein n=1 Tax=Gallaecimonas mangrovi TaxID=2291597 RepID=UPI000E20186B|nr:hypothetical protein [Gallaecimonas mangrovi]
MKSCFLLFLGCLLSFGTRAETDLAPLLTQAEHASKQADYASANKLLSQIPAKAVSHFSNFDHGRYLCVKAEMASRIDRDLKGSLPMYQSGIALLERFPPSPELLRCMLVYYQAQSWAGNLPVTLAIANKAEQVALKLGDKKGQAEALSDQGYSYRLMQMDAHALPIIEKAIELAKETGDLSVELGSSSDLALVRRDLGQPYLQLAMETNALAQSSPDISDKARAAASLAKLQYEGGHYSEALDALLAVYADVEKHASIGWQGTMASNLAEIYLALGQLDKANFYIQIALNKMAKANLIHQRMSALLTASKIAEKQGDKVRQKTLLQQVVAAQETTDSMRQNELAARALKQLAALSDGDVQQQYWQHYAKVMDDRLALVEKAKSQAERNLSLDLIKRQNKASTTNKELKAYWHLAVYFAIGLLLILLVRTLLKYRRRQQSQTLVDAGLRLHSQLPHHRASMQWLSQLLGQGRRCQLYYFRPRFSRHPFYQAGYRLGSRQQKLLADKLRAAFPDALLLGEPDTFHYLLALEAGSGQKSGPAEQVFAQLKGCLAELDVPVSGLQMATLAFPCFPQISRTTDVEPLCELLLLGLQLADEAGADSWVSINPLPVAAPAMRADNVRQALLNELQKGYIKVSTGGSDLTLEPDWALLAETV